VWNGRIGMFLSSTRTICVRIAQPVIPRTWRTDGPCLFRRSFTKHCRTQRPFSPAILASPRLSDIPNRQGDLCYGNTRPLLAVQLPGDRFLHCGRARHAALQRADQTDQFRVTRPPLGIKKWEMRGLQSSPHRRTGSPFVHHAVPTARPRSVPVSWSVRKCTPP